MTQKFWVILYWFSTPLTRLRPISRVSGKTLCAGFTPAATHIVEEVFIDRNHAGSSKAAQLRCFASGIPQGRHLQMPGRSWRAGQPSGDGKPVGPDVPP